MRRAPTRDDEAFDVPSAAARRRARPCAELAARDHARRIVLTEGELVLAGRERSVAIVERPARERTRHVRRVGRHGAFDRRLIAGRLAGPAGPDGRGLRGDPLVVVLRQAFSDRDPVFRGIATLWVGKFEYQIIFKLFHMLPNFLNAFRF